MRSGRDCLTLYDLVRRAAELLGIHASRLAKHPSQTLLGLRAKPFDLILDIGANSGQFAHEMRSIFPGAHVVSFEPLPKAFAELFRWATADGNADAHNLALGDEDSNLPINVHLAHSASSSMLATTNEGLKAYPIMAGQQQLQVPVKRLDDVLVGLGLVVGPGTLIKLDVQGFEAQVMRGAPESLARCGALLTEVSLDPIYSGQAKFLDLCHLAEAAGLRYAGNYSQFFGEDGHVIFLDALFVR